MRGVSYRQNFTRHTSARNRGENVFFIVTVIKDEKKMHGVAHKFDRLLTAKVEVLIHGQSLAPSHTVAVVGREKSGHGSF